MKKMLIAGLMLMLLCSCDISHGTIPPSSSTGGDASQDSDHRTGTEMQLQLEFASIASLEDFYHSFSERNTFSFCLPDLSVISEVQDLEKYIFGGICKISDYNMYNRACAFSFYQFSASASGHSLKGEERDWSVAISNIHALPSDFQLENVQMEVIKQEDTKRQYSFLCGKNVVFDATVEIQSLESDISTPIFSGVEEALLQNIVTFKK